MSSRASACLTRDPVFLGHITLHSPETKPTKLHTVSSRPASRDPVSRGGKVRLPQRPEVSSKQATPLPLPNRLRQPLNHTNIIISSSHDLFIAPIYYRGMGLICIILSGVGLPGVNLIIYKDDLRMMAPKPVAARAGAMKDYEEGCRNFVER